MSVELNQYIDDNIENVILQDNDRETKDEKDNSNNNNEINNLKNKRY